MGLWTSKIVDWVREKFEDDRYRILMLGLDNAGKTTLLYKLKHNEVMNTTPTRGFNVEEIKIGKRVTFTVWDGGQDVRPNLQRFYYKGSDGLLFVVDSSDRMRLQDARKEIMCVLDDGEMRGVPVVVMANKKDLPGACDASELTDALGLNSLRDHAWHIKLTSAVNGDGVRESICEMARMAREFKERKEEEKSRNLNRPDL